VRFYSQVIFPRLCDFLLRQPFVARHRQELLAHAYGDVLEIGFGTGLNLQHYPERVRKIAVVDPNIGMHKLARQRIKRSRIEIDQRLANSEQLPFPDQRFDCIVSTFTLCSIDHVDRAVGEVYRCLKPGGRFLFLEHGLSPEPRVQAWQRRLNWLEIRLADGCRLDRDIRGLVATQPFSPVKIENVHLEGTPRTHGYLYQGMAVR
jgi:SAM-dependent methyltransferase